ncbi:MAG: 4'-phosphopantetheinyl transferase superfamily protein [Prevotella sp.]|nr:4'-phosphopantetheinyl transferase superfamily protein [Prevotella sp.]
MEFNFEGCEVVVADVELLMEEQMFTRMLMSVSPERQQKARRYKFPKGKALSLGAALALDKLLQRRGLRERDQRYLEGKHGKPSFADHPEIHFSISHSSHFVACAMADCEIGIDIQHLVKVNEPLMRRVLSDEELGMVMALQGEERQMLFARLWALKEAYLKAVGTGITDDFPSFSLENDRPRLVNRQGFFLFREFDFPEGKGALCVVD